MNADFQDSVRGHMQPHKSKKRISFMVARGAARTPSLGFCTGWIPLYSPAGPVWCPSRSTGTVFLLFPSLCPFRLSHFIHVRTTLQSKQAAEGSTAVTWTGSRSPSRGLEVRSHLLLQVLFAWDPTQLSQPFPPVFTFHMSILQSTNVRIRSKARLWPLCS